MLTRGKTWTATQRSSRRSAAESYAAVAPARLLLRCRRLAGLKKERGGAAPGRPAGCCILQAPLAGRERNRAAACVCCLNRLPCPASDPFNAC